MSYLIWRIKRLFWRADPAKTLWLFAEPEIRRISALAEAREARASAALKRARKL